MEGSDAQLRAVLPCIAGHAVLQVLGLGAYPALLQEDSAVPAMWHSGPWGGREGRRGPVPNPWQHSAFTMYELHREAPGLGKVVPGSSESPGCSEGGIPFPA